MSNIYTNTKPQSRFRNIAVLLAAGCFAVVVGIGLGISYIQWNSQKSQIAELTEMLESMQKTNEAEAVTRAANVELLEVAPEVVPDLAVVQTPVAAPEPVAEPKPVVAAQDTKVDILQVLVAKAVARKVIPSQDITDPSELQAIALAIEGVDQLIGAAASGNYVVQPGQQQADGSFGTKRLVFPEYAESQSQIEDILASAASKGVISYSETAKAVDGSIDGHKILIDLMAEAL